MTVIEFFLTCSLAQYFFFLLSFVFEAFRNHRLQLMFSKQYIFFNWFFLSGFVSLSVLVSPVIAWKTDRQYFLAFLDLKYLLQDGKGPMPDCFFLFKIYLELFFLFLLQKHKKCSDFLWRNLTILKELLNSFTIYSEGI